MTFYNKESLVASEVLFYIHVGESKDKLLAQLSDIGRIRADRRPDFTVTLGAHDLFKANTHKVGLLVNGLIAEDGSGDNWIISGYVTRWPEVYAHELLEAFQGNMAFEGFYNSRNRKGWLKPS